MDEYSQVLFKFTKSPSYLKELLQSDEDVLLVHRKKPKSIVCSADPEAQEPTYLEETLELTGCPLNIDLHDETCTSVFLDRPNSWTPEEAKHYPLKVHEARAIINNLQKKKNIKLEGGDVRSVPIYCVCDGTDKKRTVLLGLSQTNGVFKRIQVFLKGCISEDSPLFSLISMKNLHIKQCRNSLVKVDSKIRSLYELYGFKMKKCYLSEECDEMGSVLVEVTDFRTSQQNALVKMMLQVIVGHNSSILNDFWHELSFLENCIRLLDLTTEYLAEEILCQEYEPIDYLIDKLYVALKESSVINRYVMQEAKDVGLKATMTHLPNLKEIYVTDKLWDILKNCKRIEELQSCLEAVLETIAYDHSIRIFLSDEDNTIIGNMISGIYNKTLIIPSLTPRQCLEILIDLGIQKLIGDYTCLLNYLDLVEKDKLVSKWKETEIVAAEKKEKSLSIPTKMSMYSTKFEHLRKTAIKDHPFLSGLNSAYFKTKLAHLMKLHTVLEFVNVIEQHNCGFISKDIICRVGREAYSEHVLKGNNFVPVVSRQIFELNVALKSTDVDIVENVTPTRWQLDMWSNEEHSEIFSVFHKSSDPIFPSCICNPCDDLSTTFSTKMYYLTQMECFSSKI